MRFYTSECCGKQATSFLGNGGLGSTPTWYSGYYCHKCKRLYCSTADGRHNLYLPRDTQKLLKISEW